MRLLRQDNKKYKNNILKKIIIIAVWLGIWQAASVLTGLEMLLPGPVNVFLCWIEMLQTGIYYSTVLHTFLDIAFGFMLAFCGGVIIGAAAGIYKVLDEFLEPAVLFMQSMPLAAFIVLMLMWFGSEKAAVYISFMVVFPMVYHAVCDGVRDKDISMLEMAQVFRLTFFKKVRYIYLPSVIPFLRTNLKAALGMCWKAGISAEVIGLVNKSIGAEIYYAKLYLLTQELFVWSITIIMVSFCFERLCLWFLDLLYRWSCC